MAALASLSGCAWGLRAADADALRDVPDHFLVGGLPGEANTEPVAEQGCRNPMVDPRDGTRLALDQSANGRGDYRVPAGRYGVPAGGRLRLDCATGRALGVVTRR